MEILEIRMDHFGKFINQNMEFHPGVNIIYGENETGKSTMRAFIRAMLYGLPRMRGRAAATDEYTIRQPWENGSWFAGGLRFQSGEKIFRIERNFSAGEKGVRLYCETDGEELSPQQGDLQALLEGFDEAAFDNTVFFGGASAQTGEELTNALRNYMLNVSFGDTQKVDLTQAIEELQSERRRLEREKKQCTAEKVELMRELSMKLDYVRQEIEELAQEEQNCREKLGRFSGDTDRQEDEILEEVLASEQEPDGMNGWKVGKIIMALTAVAALAAGLILMELPARIGCASVILLACVGVILFNREDQKKKEIVREQQMIRREQALQAAYARQRARMKRQREEAPKRQQLQMHLEWIAGTRREKLALERTLKEEYEQQQKDNGSMREVEEKLIAVTLAANTLIEVSTELYRSYAKRLNSRVSEILSEITGGKYTGVSLNENFEVCIQTPQKLLSVRQISRGSMEQVYFALRMACADLMMPEEKLPVILDDAFLTYDDTRLERALRWLAGSGHQVLLFTCHRREQEILQKIYNE